MARRHHRSVHRLGGIEMATAQRHCAVAAARLRRPGAGTFQRAHRALPPGLCRGQHPGLQSDDRCAVFSCAAPPDETRFHQAAHHHDAEESVARERPSASLSVRFQPGWRGKRWFNRAERTTRSHLNPVAAAVSAATQCTISPCYAGDSRPPQELGLSDEMTLAFDSRAALGLFSRA
jgi:hypothetical protein